MKQIIAAEAMPVTVSETPRNEPRPSDHGANLLAQSSKITAGRSARDRGDCFQI